MAAISSSISRSRSALAGAAALVLLFVALATFALTQSSAQVRAVGRAAGARGQRDWDPAAAAVTPAAVYAPHQLLVAFTAAVTVAQAQAQIRDASGIKVTVLSRPTGAPHTLLLKLPGALSVAGARARIRKVMGKRISYAVPNFLASAAGTARYVPNDRGNTKTLGGWQKLQWNFDPRAGVKAPGAWANLRAAGHPGASGVVVAVVDSGVAFQNYGQYKKSPDFSSTRFVDPCNLVSGTIRDGVCTDTHAVDRENHGTFVAGEIAESTNNYRGLTGLAYGASIMPVQVLNWQGVGSGTTVAAGIRYAADHGAQVINLSIEFDGVGASAIPEVISALSYAHSKGAVIVGASGNDGAKHLDYPAADRDVISVGATTYDRCLATYSNYGSSLDITAPGGGNDANLKQQGCRPGRRLPGLAQETFENPTKPGRFSLPDDWFGTSMAAPEVSATAAMVIASGVIGTDPTPAQVLARIEATATPLGGSRHNDRYGWGLLNADAATAAGGPTKP